MLNCCNACQVAARYLPSALPRSCCTYCGKLHDGRGKYCSSACKQAAYRRRVDSEVGQPGRRSAGAHKATVTKHENVRLMHCQHCGAAIMISATESARMYCGAACKQAAYRARRKAAAS